MYSLNLLENRATKNEKKRKRERGGREKRRGRGRKKEKEGRLVLRKISNQIYTQYKIKISQKKK